VISSIPLDWFTDGGPAIFHDEGSGESGPGNGAAQITTLLRVFKVLKLLKLLRLARVLRYVSRWEEHLGMFNSHTMRLMKVLLMVAIFVHWVACIQFYLSTYDTTDVFEDACPCLESIHCGIIHKDVWMCRANIIDLPDMQKWSWSVYHTFLQLTSISVGVIAPSRIPELWIFLFSVAGGATMYAIFVATITAVFSEADPSAREYRSQLDRINSYMSHIKLPSEVRMSVRNYYEVQYPQKRAFNEAEILGGLSRPLQQKLALCEVQKVLSVLNVAQQSSEENFALASFIANAVSRVVFVDGDVVIRQGDLNEAMYFISDGQVEVTWKPMGQGIVHSLAMLSTGSFFGEIGLLHPDRRAFATVTARAFCSGWELRVAEYSMAVKRFPHFKDILECAAKLRLLNGQLRNRGGDKQPKAHERADYPKKISRLSQAVDNAVKQPKTAALLGVSASEEDFAAALEDPRSLDEIFDFVGERLQAALRERAKQVTRAVRLHRNMKKMKDRAQMIKAEEAKQEIVAVAEREKHSLQSSSLHDQTAPRTASASPTLCSSCLDSCCSTGQSLVRGALATTTGIVSSGAQALGRDTSNHPAHTSACRTSARRRSAADNSRALSC